MGASGVPADAHLGATTTARAHNGTCADIVSMSGRSWRERMSAVGPSLRVTEWTNADAVSSASPCE